MCHFSQRYVENLHKLVYFLFWLHIKEQLSSILLRTLQEKPEQICDGPNRDLNLLQSYKKFASVQSQDKLTQSFVTGFCLFFFPPKISQDIERYVCYDIKQDRKRYHKICLKIKTFHETVKRFVSPGMTIRLFLHPSQLIWARNKRGKTC